MSEHKAWCLLEHAPYIPSNLQEKVPNVLLIHSFNFHSVCGNSSKCKMLCAPDVLQTHPDSLLKLDCLVHHPAQFLQGECTTFEFKRSFIHFVASLASLSEEILTKIMKFLRERTNT